MECSICYERFNKSTHFKVECKGCNTDDFACRKCCQTFILNGNEDPMCMFCKSPWDREFMNSTLTKKFVDHDLKHFTENIFLERQMSLLPETQKYALNEKKIREMNQKIREANSEFNRLKKMLNDQKEILRAYNLELYRLNNGMSTDETTCNNFTVKCPAEKCNGFLDSKYRCGICNTKFCKSCMEIKGENHECNEDIKATIQTIKRESKPCPGCGEMISKIDGCDQMWCIKCHIQFSLRTGHQLIGYNHNPEYFRWMRETGQIIDRNPQENVQVMCGVVLDDFTITEIVTNIFPGNLNTISLFQRLYRFYRHVEYKNTQNDADARNKERELKSLRINYLLGDISKEQWKISLQKIDKRYKKCETYNNIWRLIETVMTSLMERIITCSINLNTGDEYIKIIKDAYNFKIYANTCFINASNTFGSTSAPGIDETWREVYNFKKYIKSRKHTPVVL